MYKIKDGGRNVGLLFLLILFIEKTNSVKCNAPCYTCTDANPNYCKSFGVQEHLESQEYNC